MTESRMGEGWTLEGYERVQDLQRRAVAVLRAIELLDTLHNDTLWSDSCTIAECIESLVEALGWRHAGLVNYMLDIPDPYDDAEVDVAAQGLADGCEARLIAYLPNGVEFLGSMHLDGLSALVNKATIRRAVPIAA